MNVVFDLRATLHTRPLTSKKTNCDESNEHFQCENNSIENFVPKLHICWKSIQTNEKCTNRRSACTASKRHIEIETKHWNSWTYYLMIETNVMIPLWALVQTRNEKVKCASIKLKVRNLLLSTNRREFLGNSTWHGNAYMTTIATNWWSMQFLRWFYSLPLDLILNLSRIEATASTGGAIAPIHLLTIALRCQTFMPFLCHKYFCMMNTTSLAVWFRSLELAHDFFLSIKSLFDCNITINNDQRLRRQSLLEARIYRSTQFASVGSTKFSQSTDENKSYWNTASLKSCWQSMDKRSWAYCLHWW